jgi:hypothetical protein
MKPRLILLTGGEKAGKTPVLNTIRNVFRGRVLCISETATMLLRNDFPRPGVDISYSPELRDVFQRTIYQCQQGFDQAYLMMAEERKIKFVITDRGKLDGIAYRDEENIEDAKRLFCAEHRIDFDTELKRYAMVVHLGSETVLNPEGFETDGETFRVVPGNEEDPQKRHEIAVKSAIRLEKRLHDLYSPHPWHVVLNATVGVTGKITSFSGMVEALLAMK